MLFRSRHDVGVTEVREATAPRPQLADDARLANAKLVVVLQSLDLEANPLQQPLDMIGDRHVRLRAASVHR